MGRSYKHTPVYRLPLHWNPGGNVEGDLHNRLALALEEALATGADLHWKAPVTTFASLPLTLNFIGDARVVTNTGAIYIWNGTAWVKEPPGIHAPTHERLGGDPIPWSQANEPTGFENLIDTTISWDDGTKVFTITPTGASFNVWVHAKKFTFSAPETKDISGVIAEGNWYFYYDDTGVLQGSQTPFDFLMHAAVSVMYWDATNAKAIQLNEERHQTCIPNCTMEFLHEAFGIVFISGLGITPGTLPIPGTGAADADAEIALTDGVLHDEDLHINPHDSGGDVRFRQDLTPISQIPVFHRDTVTGVWRRKDATDFPVQEGPGAGNDRLQWNDPDAGGAGVWGLSEVGDNGFVAVFLACIPDLGEPIFAILGQEEHGTLQDAQENNNYADLALGTDFREQRVLYRLIFQTNDTYANTPKARLVDVTDLRTAQLGSPAGTIIPNYHAALSGRADADQHPASALVPATGGFDGLLSAADDTVQKALDTLDNASTPTEATATATTTTTGATDGLLAGMTLTPGAGNYMVWFSTSVDHTAANDSIWVSLYVNGVQVPDTERLFRRGGAAADTAGPLAFNKYITGVGAGQVVEVRWRTTGATANAYQRTLTLMKVA